ncbi:LysR family transcriptional regulator [Actinoplanes friuliensis]|uniref:LysR family transcriptional regulator n=1 Tax=Actinoplanes friuliensis DSM 7358 TaxID=1246995 RepID=U5WDH8_9ACTN|nr:LysR family transcriptional regulator [Actinoplanes friuliensis]AGZ46006.1 LysR family transcriptional regulator [Actinoplanes friuliensis DSM 7358]
MSDIDLRHLRYLIAVADEGGFTRAAERLGMTQPALSRAVRGLEDEVGVPLLIRLHRGVELTTAGKVLVEAARGITTAMETALRRSRQAAEESTRLRISARGCEVAAAEELKRGWAEPVEVLVTDRRSQSDVLREGGAELALIRGPFDDRGLDSDVLSTEPRIVLLHASHRLADSAVIARADLSPDPVVVWSGSGRQERDYWLGIDSGHRDVIVGPEVDDVLQMLARVRLGEAIAFAPLAMLRLLTLPDDVRTVPVDGLTDTEIRIVWVQEETSPAIARFVRYAVRS